MQTNFSNFLSVKFCTSYLDADHRTNERKRNKQNGGKNQDRDLSRDNEILNAAATFSRISTKAQLIVGIVIVQIVTNFRLFQSYRNDEAIIIV